MALFDIQTVFGRYISKDSIVHRMDPRAKLLLSLLFMVMVFAASSYPALAIAAIFTAGMFAFARISLRQAFVSIAPLAILVVFTALLNIFFCSGWRSLFPVLDYLHQSRRLAASVVYCNTLNHAFAGSEFTNSGNYDSRFNRCFRAVVKAFFSNRTSRA